MIVGTAAYIAPEQAQGKTPDKRADIWAFGVVTWEMLTGSRLFRGDSFTETLAAVLHTEPDWELVPSKIRPLLHACLEKDPKRRLRDIGDSRRLLDGAPESPVARRSQRYLWIAAAAGLASALGSWLIAGRFRQPPPETPTLRFTIPPPENTSYGPGVVSPDGRRFAFIAIDAAGSSQLWSRRLDSLTAQPLAAAEFFPFWSADSRFILYTKDGESKKISPSGGSPQTICAAPSSSAARRT